MSKKFFVEFPADRVQKYNPALQDVFHISDKEGVYIPLIYVGDNKFLVDECLIDDIDMESELAPFMFEDYVNCLNSYETKR